ncbi:WXG100 family type VII secretion target [Plantactinospora sp. B5E13]|uniref:WXG100 family type VII secretion target n=1 Tax=unclassified Plantactinospora TaxID=2631981 RepID=UPI00325C52B4
MQQYGLLQADHGAIDAMVETIKSTGNQIIELAGELARQQQRLEGALVGQAGTEYQNTASKGQQIQQKMAQILQQLGTETSNSNQNLQVNDQQAGGVVSDAGLAYMRAGLSA